MKGNKELETEILSLIQEQEKEKYGNSRNLGIEIFVKRKGLFHRHFCGERMVKFKGEVKFSFCLLSITPDREIYGYICQECHN